MILKKLVREKKKMVNLKMTPTEIAACWANARRYTRGNFSEWVRTAATEYRPKRADVTTKKAS